MPGTAFKNMMCFNRKLFRQGKDATVTRNNFIKNDGVVLITVLHVHCENFEFLNFQDLVKNHLCFLSAVQVIAVGNILHVSLYYYLHGCIYC